MNREYVKEMMPIFQAFAEGKTIEIYSRINDNWVVNDYPEFDGHPDYYRIKPEPKYRPFNSEEMEALVGKVLKHSTGGTYLAVNFTNGGIQFVYDLKPYSYTAKNLLDNWTIDGQPAGMLE